MTEDQTQVAATEAARMLAARRQHIDGRCPVCGTTFTGTTRRQYCSQKCRIAAMRRRKREEEGRGN